MVQVFCHARGFMASYHAGYDHPRGGRHVLMDYMMGKLLYCFPPPTAPHLNIYSHIIEEYESEQAAAAAAEPMVEELPADNMTVTTRTRRVMNVLDVPDTAALFSIPVPKPKSQRVSVMTSRHRARKGARDPDPYGTQAVSDPLTAMVLEESKYYTVGARPDKLAPRPSTAAREVSPDSLIGKGKGRANATTFTRVHRPYSAK